MAHPQIAAFPRLAEGNPRPTRAIAGQNTNITRTIHDLAYDPIHDEILVPQFYALAILTFAGTANGDAAPKRIIMGDKTQMKNPQRLAVDPVHNEIFVPQGRRILVFPREANGNVAPIRILEGPDTQLGASALAVDPVHNILIASGGGGGEDEGGGGGGGAQAGRVFNADGSSGGGGRLLIFDRTAQGNTKPKGVIRGPKSGIAGGYLLEVYPPKGIILAARRGRGRHSFDNYVGIWSVHDNGDVAPRWTIGGPNGMLRQVRAVTVDPELKTVIISDKFVNAILTYSFPEIF